MQADRILFISTQLPYPPHSGGTVKSWNYISFLAKKYAVSVACLLKDNDLKHLSDFKSALSIDQLITEEINVARSPINLVKSYLFSSSLNVFRNYSPSFKEKINAVINDYPLVIFDHYEVFQYLPKSYSGKIVLHTHNAEFMLWKRMSELTGNPFKKLILSLESKRVKRYEEKFFELADLVYSTPSDIQLYKDYGLTTEKHRITYHLGNDELLNLPDLTFESTEKAITFVGTLSWEPNIDGIVWFLNECWPNIKSKVPGCKLYILGSKADQRIINAAKNDTQVILTGFVKDLDEYLQKTRVYIAPLRFGSGMKVKVLEGLYRGTPIVSTSVGAEGLEVYSGEELMIADTPETFAKHCTSLLQNKTLWNRLRDTSRKVAAEKYRWLPLFEKMDDSMKMLFR